MFVRNLLQAGEYVTLVPNGIPIKLEYGSNGTLEKVHVGYDESYEISKEVIPVIMKSKCIPLTVTIHKGQTFVYGVFKPLSNKKYIEEGWIPDCNIDNMLEDFKADPDQFKFFAGEVSSTAAVFKGAVPIRQWLTTSGFQLLSGYLVPANLTEDSFKSMIRRDYADYPIVTHYIIYHRDGTTSHTKLSVYQCIIGDVKDYTTEYGYIQREFYTKDKYIKYVVPYSEAYIRDLHVGKRVFMMNNIIHTDDVSDGFNHVDSSYVCKWCGRKLHVPNDARKAMMCSDSQCNSVLYPRVSQLLKGLYLPVISFARYKEITDSIGSIFSVLDILDVDEYKEFKFSGSLYQVVRAIIPKTILPGDQHVMKLCRECNDTVATFIYYIQNPDKMKVDLSLDDHVYKKLLNWLEDPCNVSDIVSLLCHERITIEHQEKRFDGPPIFRGKNIAITGKFFHGSSEDVESIFLSYAANIVNVVDSTLDCLIVGDLQEDVDGNKVMKAKKLGVPIFSEYKFFNKYDIDKDLSENL